MKHKRIPRWGVILIALIGTAVVCWGAYFVSKSYFPTTQMRTLRQTEAQLQLPKPDERREVDKGEYTDTKGAVHFDRYIALTYYDTNKYIELSNALVRNGWTAGPSMDLSATQQSFSYTKGVGEEQQCVTGFVQGRNGDQMVYAKLESFGNYSCRP